VNTSDIRQKVDRLIASGDSLGASRELAQLWAHDSSSACAGYVVARYEQLRPNLNLLPYRLAILRSFTVEPMVMLLRAATFSAGIDLTVHLSEFNAYAPEIFDPASKLYSFAPDVVILAVQTRDIAPDLWRDFAGRDDEHIQQSIDRVRAEFQSWIRAFRDHSQAHLIVHNLEEPEVPANGILDSQSESGQSAAIRKINSQLAAMASEQSGLYILDYDALVSRYGRAQWHDERKWLVMRLPVAAHNLIHLVNDWLRFLHPLTGKTAKAVAVDLDNTLWGGVIGEEGLAGIRLGTEYPGAAYQEIQRSLLDLRHRGILLAICSKNNSDDAMEALRKHPGMLLRPEHFAAMRISWADKSQNLRAIAQELNIGIDSLAFIDDNPVERQQIRQEVPEAFVLELPDDPMACAGAIRQCPRFERLSLLAEDQQRSDYYQQHREREHLQKTALSREEFYRSLQQEIEIDRLDKSTLSRIAQLTNKTNQFNLTTHRYSEQQILELANSPDWDIFHLRVRDRFGDNGLVGVAITHRTGAICEIDSLLLSCRVIGRTVETAFLSFLADHARKQGAQRLRGWFLPTQKNEPARDFYPNHGFEAVKQNGRGTLWDLDAATTSVQCPDWIRLHILDGDKG
jgi:FkbH-like protein